MFILDSKGKLMTRENEGYALELVGDDNFMSAQSWGVGLESGAKNHFMEISN
jgi:hypothetical protein